MRLATMAVAAVAILAMVSEAHAETGYLSIKGQKTGDIKGDVTAKGHENWNSVQSLEYGIASPVDAASGMATGRRTHQGITFILKWSKATPLLVNAASTGETLSEVHFQRWMPQINGATSIGTEVNADTIDLSNARITSLKIVDQKNDDGKLDTAVIVSMVYQKLTITHQDGGISADDTWATAQ